jgi:hypothetical protein
MAQDIVNNDLLINGNVNCTQLTVSQASIADAAITASAKIQSSKLEHRFMPQYAQESATTATSEARMVHRVRGATATILDYTAGVVVANAGGATVTFDLLKNGVSILTSVITIDNTTTAYTVKVAGGFTSTALLLNDVLEIKLVAALGGGTLAKGAFAQVNLREDAA